MGILSHFNLTQRLQGKSNQLALNDYVFLIQGYRENRLLLEMLFSHHSLAHTPQMKQHSYHGLPDLAKYEQFIYLIFELKTAFEYRLLDLQFIKKIEVI